MTGGVCVAFVLWLWRLSSWILGIWSLCTCISNLCVFPGEAVSRIPAEGFLPIRTWQRETDGFLWSVLLALRPLLQHHHHIPPSTAPFQPLHPPWPAVYSLYSLMKASDHIFMLKPLRQIPWRSGFLKADTPGRLWVKALRSNENRAGGLSICLRWLFKATLWYINWSCLN